MNTAESPGVFAGRIGILPRNKIGRGVTATVTWDQVLEFAVAAYWARRPYNGRAAA